MRSQTASVRGRIARGAALWWDAWGSGVVLNRWSALVSLLVAAVFSVPAVQAPALEAYARGMLIGAGGWLVLAVCLTPVVVVEKLARRQSVRAVVVLAAVVAAAATRPFVNDAVSVLLWGSVPLGSWPARAISNTVTVLALFSLVALIVAQHRSTRAAVARLRVASVQLDAAVAACRVPTARLGQRLADTVAALRSSRDAMLAATIDFDTVRAYSDLVRAASHRLASAADDEPAAHESAPPLPGRHEPGLSAARGVATAPRRPRMATPTRSVRVAVRHRLRPTPLVSVCLLYALACAPLAAAVAGLPAAVMIVALAVPIDLVAGAVVRAGERSARPAVVFVATWVSAGLAGSLVGLAIVPAAGILAFVPLLAIPTTAIIVSLCRDALSRVRQEERDAAAELARIAAESARGQTHATERVKRATDLLHGGLQGRCVVFAAAVDEDEPTPAQIEAFRAATDAVLDEVVAPPAEASTSARAALESVIDAWDAVIVVTSQIDAATVSALEATYDAEAIVRIVNEALLNAVKHSAARSATLRIAADEPGLAHVSVSSAGVLSTVARSGLGTRDGDTHLHQDGDEVVLEARVPLVARRAA